MAREYMFFLYMSKVPRLKCWIMRCIKVGVNPSQKTMLNSSTEEPSMAQLLMPNHLFSFHFKGFKQRGIHEFKSKWGMDQVYQAIQFFADAGISTWRFVTFFSCHLLAFSFPLLFLQVTFSAFVFLKLSLTCSCFERFHDQGMFRRDLWTSQESDKSEATLSPRHFTSGVLAFRKRMGVSSFQESGRAGNEIDVFQTQNFDLMLAESFVFFQIGFGSRPTCFEFWVVLNSMLGPFMRRQATIWRCCHAGIAA